MSLLERPLFCLFHSTRFDVDILLILLFAGFTTRKNLQELEPFKPRDFLRACVLAGMRPAGNRHR